MTTSTAPMLLGCRVGHGPMSVLSFRWPFRPEGSDDILHRAPRVHHAARRGRRLVFGCGRADCEETAHHRHVRTGDANSEQGIAVSPIILGWVAGIRKHRRT